MNVQLDGATRLFGIIGDPVAQVQSPAGLTRAMQARGCNAVLVPLHVAATDLADFLLGASLRGAS
ncbi:MAG TPA: hypothetical protein VHY76_09895 [Acetobacteraceae bacterium]|jgi:shikimate dehydrogenase|nr:hypothetical protein [Acetobacteraceae bacterium]